MEIIDSLPDSPGYLRRHESALLLVGSIEPQIGSWLHADGCVTRAVTGADAALAALGEEPADLIASSGARRRPPSAGPARRPAARRGLAAGDHRRGEGRMADSVLHAGADDYLHRPFTRAELLARARAGLRAAQQRSNDRCCAR